jgi:hypothetical protein
VILIRQSKLISGIWFSFEIITNILPIYTTQMMKALLFRIFTKSAYYIPVYSCSLWMKESSVFCPMMDEYFAEVEIIE